MKQKIEYVTQKIEHSIIISYETKATALYGLGERYVNMNHKDIQLRNKVHEKFCEQGEHTYFPIPFFHCNDGHGLFIDTAYEFDVLLSKYDDQNCRVEITFEEDATYELHFFYGTPKEIISQFVAMTGKNALPPKWAFGVWISANRWNCQAHIEEQMNLAKQYEYPVGVVVIEAWSDEATFYLWNGTTHQIKSGKERVEISEMNFHEPWPDPVNMINALHENGTRLVLWQIPVLKKLDEGQISMQHEVDCVYALEHELVVKDAKGNPYRIPKQWFVGSFVPDYTNPELINWWFNKRQYLLDMGVDGFKTDGGEFIHDVDCTFFNGETGKTQKNEYPFRYEKAYYDFAGQNHLLFSRAGYTKSQTAPMHWAGDQLSKYSELKDVLKAGLSLALSGVFFWSFDIGGFAGAMPSVDLYKKATALAAFVPAMQWHSEPLGGQFADIYKSELLVNDRSPWNMSAIYGEDKGILEDSLFYAYLHMNFLPYFYSEAIKSVQNNQSFMKPLYLEYPEDEQTLEIEDEYMIGDLLIAPVLEENARNREIYLPAGTWYNLWNHEELIGEMTYLSSEQENRIPVFVRRGAVLPLNLNVNKKLGMKVGNKIQDYEGLTMIYYGNDSNYQFYDESGNVITVLGGKFSKKKISCELISYKDIMLG